MGILCYTVDCHNGILLGVPSLILWCFWLISVFPNISWRNDVDWLCNQSFFMLSSHCDMSVGIGRMEGEPMKYNLIIYYIYRYIYIIHRRVLCIAHLATGDQNHKMQLKSIIYELKYFNCSLWGSSIPANIIHLATICPSVSRVKKSL